MWGSKPKPPARGETVKPKKNKCPRPDCDNTKKGRSVWFTCGGRKCIQWVQAQAVEDADTDNRDPARNAKVKIDGRGSVKRVVRTTTKHGQHCVVLEDGMTVPISRVEVQ